MPVWSTDRHQNADASGVCLLSVWARKLGGSRLAGRPARTVAADRLNRSIISSVKPLRKLTELSERRWQAGSCPLFSELPEARAVRAVAQADEPTGLATRGDDQRRHVQYQGDLTERGMSRIR